MRWRILAAAVAACFIAPVYANPIGAQVVNGVAAINQAGNTLTVTNSPNAIINWQSFSINPAETTRFIQQSAASAVLNRVLGPDPSQLLGVLQSNGRVFLINPAGILVGQGAKIDVAGFVASTLNLSDADFLANKLNFGPSLNAGAIQNLGSITTPDGGTVYLVAPQVTNQGIITTPKGETILAAGNTVQLIDSGAPGVAVQITGSAGNATNLGQILADAGRIGMVAAAVKNSGTLSATSLVNQGGRIYLKATQAVTVDGAASISATGTAGGTIEVLGSQVVLDGTATLDASGANGGGTILVGGDAHGANPNVQNALNTFVGAGVTLKADSTLNGNGGKVIVWADDTTLMYGYASARGGAQGGNGGFIETSGKRYLAVTNAADVGAPLGKGGIWLLDPQALTVIGAGWLGVGTPLATTASPFTAIAALGPSTVTDTVLVAALALGGNVVLDTGAGVCAVAGACNITIDVTATGLGAINVPAATGPGTTLTMNAADSIFINAPIATATANPLNIVMSHGAGGTAWLGASLALGTGFVDVQSAGVAGSGTLNVNYAGTTTLTGGLTVSTLHMYSGILNLDTATTIANLSMSGTGTLGGTGAVNVQGPGTMTWQGGTLAGTGVLTLTGTLNATGATACPTCLTTIMTLNKPLVIAAGSTANFGSGTANGSVQINVGAGGSATNNAGATMSFDNVNVLNVGGAGAFTNAGTVYVGPVVQQTATARAPATGGSTNIPFVNNGGTVYFADDLLFSGPVTLNGGLLIGATLFSTTPIPTTSAPFVTFNGALTINDGAGLQAPVPLTLNNVALEAFGTTTQGVLGGAASNVVLNGGTNIHNSGTWTMNNAVYSLALPGVAPTPLSGFYTSPMGTVNIAGPTAFNVGVSFNNAGVMNMLAGGVITNGNFENLVGGVMNVAAAYAGHLTNNGTLTVAPGANFAGDVSNNASMSINSVGGVGSVVFQRSLYNSSTGTINMSNVALSINNDLMNAGTIHMTNSVVNTCLTCAAGTTGVSFGSKGIVNVTGANTVNYFGMGLGGSLNGVAAATDSLTVVNKLGFTGAATLNNMTLNTSPGALSGGINNPTPYTLTMSNGAVFNNGGTWTMQAGDSIVAGTGVASAFNNLLTTGVLNIDALAGSASIGVPLVSSGSLSVLSGSFFANDLTVSGGTVSAPTGLSLFNYQQTAGALSTGSFNVSNAFNQTGGSITATSVALNAVGAITQTAGSIISPNLIASASGGISLAGTNQIGNFSSVNNAVSGNVTLSNTIATSLGAISNPVGNITVTNAGTLTSTGSISASGAINLTATGADLIQTAGSISNSTGVAGANDVTFGGVNITLQSVQSQHHVVLNATSNVNLLASGSGGFIDDTFFVYNMPFTFNYFGTPYTQAFITTNGLIMFGSGTPSYTDSLVALGGLVAIAPAWNDWMLNASLGKDIRIGFGAGDMRVRYDVVSYANTALNAQFETVLNSNGTIKFNYGAANFPFVASVPNTYVTNDVTIGISNGLGTAMASQLMALPTFSMNNLRSTTFTPNGLGGYTETLSATNTALSPLGSVSGSAILGQGTGTVVTAAFGNMLINAGGLIYAPSQLSAQSLQFTSTGGAAFTGTNFFGGITSGVNTGAGDIVLYNNDLLSISGALNSTTGNIDLLVGGSGITFAPTSSITAPLGIVTATTPYGAITNQSATLTASGLVFSSLASINLTQALTATQSISLTSSGAIIGAAPASLNAPSVQLAAGAGIGSALTPLQLVTANLNATTVTGGGNLFNTPIAAVTLGNFTTNDASPLTYSQNGQNLNLTGVISSAGGNVLIDPPVNLTMSPTSSVSSGGGSVGMLATGDILLATINAGAGAATVNTTAGAISSVLPAGQTNITAGNVTASAFNGISLAFVAPTYSFTTVNGTITVTNNTPTPAPAVPVLVPTAVTTAVTTATTPPPTITPLVSITPIFITAPDPNMPMLVGPEGGTIGGEPGTFGGPEITSDETSPDSTGSDTKDNGEKEIGSEKPASC